MRGFAVNGADMVEEAVDLVALLATAGGKARELNDDDKAIVELAKSMLGLGSSVSKAFGGEVGEAVGGILGLLPVEVLARWLASFRSVAVVIREGVLTVGEGVDAVVDLER